MMWLYTYVFIRETQNLLGWGRTGSPAPPCPHRGGAAPNDLDTDVGKGIVIASKGVFRGVGRRTVSLFRSETNAFMRLQSLLCICCPPPHFPSLTPLCLSIKSHHYRAPEKKSLHLFLSLSGKIPVSAISARIQKSHPCRGPLSRPDFILSLGLRGSCC